MNVPNDSIPNQEPTPTRVEVRLDATIESNPENGDLNLHAVVDEVMGRLFEPEEGRSFSQFSCLVGGSDEAIAAVREGLVSRLERKSKDGLTGRDLEASISCIGGNYADPEPTTLDAMKHRTDELERLFSVRELENAIIGSNGRYISYSGEVDHPEFSWVKVSADNHSINGIKYVFFAEKPSEDSRAPGADLYCHVHIGHINKRNAPNAVSDEYPFFTESYVVQERRENGFEEEISLDVPSDMAPLLSDLARTMIIETLVEQGGYMLELSERTRKWFNIIASRIVEKVVDPVKAREALEELGIYEDPDNFKKNHSEDD